MNTAKLDKVFKQVNNLSKGLPADWDKISDSFDWYMEANYPDKVLFELSEQEQEKIFTALRNIKKGDDTI